jgi:hypothetical protein
MKVKLPKRDIYADDFLNCLGDASYPLENATRSIQGSATITKEQKMKFDAIMKDLNDLYNDIYDNTTY